VKTPRLRHRLEFLGFRVLSLGAWLLPEPVALALGAGVGHLAGTLVRIRRRVVDENLARAFPGESRAWRNRVARGAYRHVGREGVALLRLARTDLEGLRSRVALEGVEVAREAFGRGQGVIIMAGHLGNWEVGGGALAIANLPVDVVAQVQHNPLFDAELVAIRNRLGMRVIPRGEATRQGLRSLREGRGLGLVADQNVRSGGIFVDFFGVPASTPRGPGLLALRTGAAVVTLMCLREAGARSRYRVHFQEVPVPTDGEPEEAIREVMESCTEILERYIRAAPEQYFWFHKRWKTRPSQEPSPSGDV
jgi:Kdo2-lipid IVA lauroyltransferase/acyltransferase